MEEDVPPLTAREIAELRELVPFAAAIREEAEYSKARALVFRHWRGAIIAAAGLVAAGVVLWEHGRRVLQAASKFLSGLS